MLALELNADEQRRWTSRKRTAFFPRNWLAHLHAVNLDNRNAVNETLHSLLRYRSSKPVKIYTGSSVKQTLSKVSRLCTLTSYGKSIHLYYRYNRLPDLIDKIIWNKLCTAWPTLGLFPPPRDNYLMLVCGRIFMIVWPCIVTDSLWIKPTDAPNSNFIGVTTLHVSGSLSPHHQEFVTVHRLWYILCSCDDRLVPGVGWNLHPTPGSKRSSQLHKMHQSRCRLTTPDDGQKGCPKHVES